MPFYQTEQTQSNSLSFPGIIKFYPRKEDIKKNNLAFYFPELQETSKSIKIFNFQEDAKKLLQNKGFSRLFDHIETEIINIIKNLDKNVEVVINSEEDIEIPTWQTIDITFFIDKMHPAKKYELWDFLEFKIRGIIKKMEENCTQHLEKEKIRAFNKTISIAIEIR